MVNSQRASSTGRGRVSTPGAGQRFARISARCTRPPWLIPAALAFLLLLPAGGRPEPALAQGAGCRPELRGETGARVAVQVVGAGEQPTTALEARSGQVLRLLVRPVEGSSRPSGPECPVRVRFSRLSPVARQLTRTGFVFDRGTAYAQLGPDEERAIDFEIKPFAEWEAVPDKVEVENVTISFPEGAEFVGRLPAPAPPAPGTVCADVVYTDARPAAGVSLGLVAPPNSPRDVRQTDPDGRACWEGFDPLRFGELALQEPAEEALGLPRTRYVSYEARQRLFVIKAPS